MDCFAILVIVVVVYRGRSRTKKKKSYKQPMTRNFLLTAFLHSSFSLSPTASSSLVLYHLLSPPHALPSYLFLPSCFLTLPQFCAASHFLLTSLPTSPCLFLRALLRMNLDLKLDIRKNEGSEEKEKKGEKRRKETVRMTG